MTRSSFGLSTVKRRIWRYVAFLYLAACILLGGASAGGPVANAVLQVAAVLIIVALLWSGRAALPREGRPLAWILGLFLLLCLATLIPLPASIWTSLPMREGIAEGFRLLGMAPPALPASLAPNATLASLMWLLPPAAMFALGVALSDEDRRRLPAAIVTLALLSIALGVFQLIGGPGSPLRFYSVTNSGSPVGFFANINHQATLLLCAIACCGYIAARFATNADRSKRGGGAMIMGAALIMLTAGILIAGSVAGYGLLIPVALASFLIYRRAVAGPLTLGWKLGLGFVLLLFGAAAMLGPIGQETLSNKLGPQATSRPIIWEQTLEAAGEAFPTGTGLGTFADVYRRFEDPALAMSEYVNHAHNDYLEVALELGLAGVLLVAGFLLWWALRSVVVWRTDFRGAGLARSSSVIIGIVLLHSLVDYPIRTSAIAAIFALACALMLPSAAPAPAPRKSRSRSESLRHLEAA